MRIALLLSSVAFAACTVGEIDSENNMMGSGSGGGSGSGSGSNMGVDPNVCIDRLAPPGPLTKHTAPVVAGNDSNAGQNCIQAGCHLNSSLGSGAPGFQFAGTVFKTGTTQPDAGVAVRIVSNSMVVASTYTDEAGNFYIAAGTLSGAFTASTSVSACPTVTKMVTPLVGGSGGGGANSCNSCHTTGANAQAQPIFL
jgi:hypothetical protein